MSQPPPAHVQYQPKPPAGGGLGIASLVLGIIACVIFCVPGVPMLLGILAIIFGAIALSQGGPVGNGKAKAGLILGVLGLALSTGFWIAARAGFSYLGRKAQENGTTWQKQLQDAQKKIEEERKKAEEDTKAKTNPPATQPGSMLGRPTDPIARAARVGIDWPIPTSFEL
jgi:hypothetical protein